MNEILEVVVLIAIIIEIASLYRNFKLEKQVDKNISKLDEHILKLNETLVKLEKGDES